MPTVAVDTNYPVSTWIIQQRHNTSRRHRARRVDPGYYIATAEQRAQFFHLLYLYITLNYCNVVIYFEALGVSGYTHAHALTKLRHACSGLGFL
jgi:hypothetical protein